MNHPETRPAIQARIVLTVFSDGTFGLDGISPPQAPPVLRAIADGIQTAVDAGTWVAVPDGSG